MSKNGQPMINMVLRVLMEASAVELAVSVALMVLALVALKIFSLASLVGVVQVAIPMHLVKEMTFNIGSTLSLKKRFLARTKKLNTIVRQPAILVTVRVRNQELAQ